MITACSNRALVLGVLGLTLVALFLGGCNKDLKVDEPFEKGSVVTRAGDPPSFKDLAAKYNQRVAKLNSLWARADIRLEFVDDNGDRQREEAEATLQCVLPRKFSFMISKISEHYFTLGCDDEKYWWIDRKDSPPTIMMGRHAMATRKKAALLGVPLLPLEMVECLGVTPLPASAKTPPTRWSPLKQSVVFVIPAGSTPDSGTIEYWIDPQTADPRRIRIFDAKGGLTVDCHHEDIAMVKVGAGLDEATRMASKLKVFVPQRETILTISLNSMEHRSLNGSKAFDLAALKNAYRIDREIDVDDAVAKQNSVAPAGVSR